jgi:hypothetical protein
VLFTVRVQSPSEVHHLSSSQTNFIMPFISCKNTEYGVPYPFLRSPVLLRFSGEMPRFLALCNVSYHMGGTMKIKCSSVPLVFVDTT